MLEPDPKLRLTAKQVLGMLALCLRDYTFMISYGGLLNINSLHDFLGVTGFVLTLSILLLLPLFHLDYAHKISFTVPFKIP